MPTTAQATSGGASGGGGREEHAPAQEPKEMVAALGRRPAKDRRCTLVADPTLPNDRYDEDDGGGEADDVVVPSAATAWNKRRRETLAALPREGEPGFDEHIDLLEVRVPWILAVECRTAVIRAVVIKRFFS